MLEVRLSSASDHAALAALFEEMQAHYDVPCPPREKILEGLASMPTGTEILVATQREIVGFAAITPVYPGPGLGSGLFLKELFVSKQHRGSGVGKSLIQGLAKLALERGHARIDWTADRDNPRLRAFYEGLGGVPKPEKLFYRFEGSALHEAAKQGG
ncbi:GNAT superfamily N-acetyltransferase [Phyllobacterium ifriqiyense]|uniref:GNAT superfamily N-acetyltransferase n=2 Tax=Phyllobacterium ifriqiyense TaxID=314238 RepID=A0ABU0SAA4_9HYPH|nr:GNAT family N-acetyltransferase [Phyllobacterium ifriqiyense]MDQ0997698.1 GNAT superfamily N-acetyltransferase [Phyllobacterium ifriqiyense]